MHDVLLLMILISSLAYIFGGVLILLKKNWPSSHLSAMTALSAGLLLSIAILDLIPDTGKDLSDNSMFIMAGFVLMYVIQLISRGHAAGEGQKKENRPLTGLSTGMLLHNFFEGLSIGMSYEVNVHLGLIVSLALVIHKIPEGLAYSSAMMASSHKRTRTAGSLMIQGASLWLGAGCAVLMATSQAVNEMMTAIALSIISGIFLYIGGSSLLPAVNSKSFRWIPYFFIGGIMFYIVFHHFAKVLS